VGLPQNMFPSSLLGNVYLHSLDVAMREAGFDYHRYMDDVRVVARDESEARVALRAAIVHLRKLELSVNGKKTQIVRPGSTEWEAMCADPDPEMSDIDRLLDTGDEAQQPTVVAWLNAMLRRVLAEKASPSSAKLRFCVNRLQTLRRIAVGAVPEVEERGPDLMRLLRDLPEETASICQYFGEDDCSESVVSELSKLLTAEPACIYGCQNYRLWLLAAKRAPNRPELLTRARSLLQGNCDVAELAGAALYLGQAGDDSDAAELVDLLLNGGLSISVRRCLCIAIQLFDITIRESAWARVADSSESMRTLVRHIGALPSPVFVGNSRRVSWKRVVDELPDNY
jgi:hypothetical protein